MKTRGKDGRPSRPGSLGYQLLQVLDSVFRPGASRHTAKQRGEADVLIFGIQTMRKYTDQAFELAEFIKDEFPECRRPSTITPEICAAFMEALVDRGLAGGTLGRYVAFICKLDRALRRLGRVPAGAPPLLPTKEQGGEWSFRANTSTLTYTEDDALAILRQVQAKGSDKYKDVAAQVVELMLATGLRIAEAAYLRAEWIDLDRRQVCLVKNTSRTKGGKPRVTAPFDLPSPTSWPSSKPRARPTPMAACSAIGPASLAMCEPRSAGRAVRWASSRWARTAYGSSMLRPCTRRCENRGWMMRPRG